MTLHCIKNRPLERSLHISIVISAESCEFIFFAFIDVESLEETVQESHSILLVKTFFLSFLVVGVFLHPMIFVFFDCLRKFNDLIVEITQVVVQIACQDSF